MNELHVLMTLAGIHFLALMSPGPDFALVVQNSTRYGRQTGVLIAFGLSMGILTHSILSLTGISYLVHAHPQLFFIVQLLGGSYLAYLGLSGLKSLFNQRKATSTSSKKTKTLPSLAEDRHLRAGLRLTYSIQKR